MAVRTEKEKMLAGEKYNCLDADLEVERQAAKGLMRRFNQTETDEERAPMLKEILGGIGKNSLIWTPFYFVYGKNIHLGDHVFLSYMCTILDPNEVRIGNHVMVGPMVQMYTAAHDLQAAPRNRGVEIAMPIVIGENVWIGGGAILLPGVSIGMNSVVGAGAVVSKDVPENVVVVGNPARVIREIEQ